MKILPLVSSVIVGLVMLSACGGSDKEWPQEEQAEFMTECVPQASEAEGIDAAVYCDCMLQKVMDKYPDPEDAEKLDIGEMFEMAQDCSEDAS